MNELIQKLADEATKHFPATETSGEFSTFDKEKFAALVIRQCGYYADIFDSLGCPGDMDPTETKPSDFIKRQFGIEDV